jgi:hypothetical protein
MLRALRNLATGNARLFCSFPCSDSRPALTRKERWGMVLPYGHLHYFSKRSSELILSDTGWRVQTSSRASTTSLPMLIRSHGLRGLAYGILVGSKDQLYVSASPELT